MMSENTALRMGCFPLAASVEKCFFHIGIVGRPCLRCGDMHDGRAHGAPPPDRKKRRNDSKR